MEDQERHFGILQSQYHTREHLWIVFALHVVTLGLLVELLQSDAEANIVRGHNVLDSEVGEGDVLVEGFSDHLRVLLDSFLADLHCLGTEADDLAWPEDQSSGLGLPDADAGSREASGSVVDIVTFTSKICQVDIFDA